MSRFEIDRSRWQASKDLTDQWDQHGVKDSQEYATLTDIIYQAWAGKSAKDYKKFKGLKKVNFPKQMR